MKSASLAYFKAHAVEFPSINFGLIGEDVRTFDLKNLRERTPLRLQLLLWT